MESGSSSRAVPQRERGLGCTSLQGTRAQGAVLSARFHPPPLLALVRLFLLRTLSGHALSSPHLTSALLRFRFLLFTVTRSSPSLLHPSLLNSSSRPPYFFITSLPSPLSLSSTPRLHRSRPSSQVSGRHSSDISPAFRHRRFSVACGSLTPP